MGDKTTESKEIAIKISDVKKKYKLGQIGGGTLQADLQSWWAKVRGKEDPNSIIGQEQRLTGQTFMALNGVNLTVYKGEALGIIGGNGAGKSTLLKLLSRVTAPTQGRIELYGRVASMLEVGTGFNGEMTGRENIYMNGAILGMTKDEIDTKMEDIIEFSEVRDFIDTPVKRYSSGMYVKLAFSVAAHLDSEIMIMDEVLAVGDVAFQKKCLSKMKSVANHQGRTVLYVSHSMNTIRQLCDRCIVMDKGKIIYVGDVETAIEMYMGTIGKPLKEYRYCDVDHNKWVPRSKYMFEASQITNRDTPICKSGETLRFKISLNATQSIKNVGLRFEIKHQNSSLVGTMLTDTTIDIEPGHMEVIIDFSTMHLVPGRYVVDMVSYQFDVNGAEAMIDGVYPGFLVDILENEQEHNYLIWKDSKWGYTKLHDVNIL